jgi:hypothetical protein
MWACIWVIDKVEIRILEGLSFFVVMNPSHLATSLMLH